MFKPVNRHILIELVTDQSKESALIVLPEDYEAPKEKYATARVLCAADDVRFDLGSCPEIIIDQSMIEQIAMNNTTYSVIQDNYVVGIIT